MLGEYPVQANIPVSDLDKARSFYSDTLGLELADEIAGEDLHYRCAGGTWLEIYRTRSGVGCGHTEAGFQVTGIEELVDGLQARGVEFRDYDLGDGLATVDGILTLSGGGGEKAAWFTDPEGNVIGLFETPAS